MAITPKNTNTVDQKKIALAAISKKIGKSLPELKAMLGEKKFEKRLKKVFKLLFKGIPETASLPAVTKKTTSPVSIKTPKTKLVATKPKTIKRPATKKAVSSAVSVIKKPLKKAPAAKTKIAAAADNASVNNDTAE